MTPEQEAILQQTLGLCGDYFEQAVINTQLPRAEVYHYMLVKLIRELARLERWTLDATLAALTRLVETHGEERWCFTFTAEQFDRAALQVELGQLQAMLQLPEPDDPELIELGRQHHGYYGNRVWAQQRVDDIGDILR